MRNRYRAIAISGVALLFLLPFLVLGLETFGSEGGN